MTRHAKEVETVWRKRSSKAYYQEIEEKEDSPHHILEREHDIMDRAQPRSTDAASGGASIVETDCPQYGQPSDQGRLKTRQDLHLTPQLGMTWLEFYDDLWRQKSRVPELSRSVVCVGLCSAILTQYRLVTGRQTDSGLAR